ncbi:unnamed protein product [marine sediment metagenome]|uniref:Uncharacterized protein n=1 Tax=marine sediment metagenome TaxID=412755 RepID=X1CYM1_9ZZZZ
MAVIMHTTGSLEVLKRIAQKRREHWLCYLLSVIPALYPFGSRKDDSRGQCI